MLKIFKSIKSTFNNPYVKTFYISIFLMLMSIFFLLLIMFAPMIVIYILLPLVVFGIIYICVYYLVDVGVL